MSAGTPMPESQTLMTGLAFGESPRWHDDRLWFCDWVAHEIIAVDLEGKSEVVVRVPFPSFPFSIDWLPDGRLLIVSTSDRPLLRRELDGSLVAHAANLDRGWNEIVVDARGNAYINGAGFDPLAGEEFAPGVIAMVAPDGSARPVADGICLDAENAVWYGDVPNQRCVRVREGGEVLQTVDLDRGCFACALGGAGNRTLFMMATEWRGFEGMEGGPRTGQVLMVDAPAPGVAR